MGDIPVITLLGSSGGVAGAILSILNKSAQDKNDPIHNYTSCCKLHLVDHKQKDIAYFSKLLPDLKDRICLYEFDVNDSVKFIEHLKHTNTELVIDASWADTVDAVSCCNKLGIPYISSALENTSVDENEDVERFGLLERYRIFEENKNKFTKTVGIVGSGMNPGVVQWMFMEMLNKAPDEIPLGCYIVEHDTSFYEDRLLADKDTVYTTWSPECFLDEAILNYPMFVKQHMPLIMYREVYEQEFKVSLGKKQFYGCLMPHEEVVTLGKLYDMEFGFIYRVNEHTTELIRKNIDNTDVLWDRSMAVLDPEYAVLAGEDLVGVLFVYDDKERYMYNVLNNTEISENYHTNATYFQVACGMYGAIASILLDNLPLGVYYVDELIIKTNTNYGKYLTYYMKDFVIGENNFSEGLLLDRVKIV